MPYKEYKAPGVDVIIQRQQVLESSVTTRFFPVFIGTGLTSKNRVLNFTDVVVDSSLYPIVGLEFPISGELNVQTFKDMSLTLSGLSVKTTGDVLQPLTETTDYVVLGMPKLNESTGIATIEIEFTETAPVVEALSYNFDVTVENSDGDFDLRLISSQDQYYARDIFGPHKLIENGNEFFNDIAIAAEIAFRVGTPYFYYLEVPRSYGAPATEAQIQKELDKVYYKKDAYRIVALSEKTSVSRTVSDFVTALSNPVDRREVVSFVNFDVSEITDLNDINELEEKVGGFSNSLNNNRVANVFGGESVELVIGSERLVLPMYFMNVALAAFDTALGMAEPLSTREITVFSKMNGPRFRPRDWDKLARHGVWIVYQNDPTEPIVIRHQLTTAQSEAAEDQEYSIVKNFDAVTKRFRDRMKPYAGQYNITSGFLERVDGTMTSTIEEIKADGLAREIVSISPWTLRKMPSAQGTSEEKRNLVSKWQMSPMYPANNLDIILLV